ncbi:leucine-rich repeat-containing protein 18 [Melanotaenia boesemani]|uniref:leucine-rich repeat-containing protein 18 n=1 Tax=Melanotaenia boesemani TaxID=1250792 RepID=UPI001C040BC7|nr:leucine-rich repeat-containing protein 18 [Melanotaenia boesemani]XP_041866184.1 leucine-rich repeat-containing protein 18 [Melanotaenia boesemani]XP_041866185.1 leucine-rich repeat-containing protein 18 [Melanotaenia boesemani]XP_041866186.1 leucine-rich repeat-containing protein 18 [Melanotaenia boesemani]
MMPKGKGAKRTKVTLKTAKKAIRITLDGRRKLTLSNMGITVFPKCLFKVPNVDELDLSRNLIQKLPDNIDKLSSLIWLDLHSNKLESVPESIGNMVVLTHLNLANNCLTPAGLPSSLGSLTNLKSLNLGMNQLDALPPTLERLSSLRELGLFDNLFIKPPEFLKVLRNLTKVNVKRNPFTYSQGDGEAMKKKKPELKEDAFLVHESCLCSTCLTKAQREGLTRGRGCDAGNVFQKEKKRNYSGLMTPNSVAKVNQDVWRIKEKVEDKQTIKRPNIC